MPRFDVSAAFSTEAQRLLGIARGADKAVERAAGTLARRLPVEARRDIQQEFNLSAARIREGISVRRGDGYVELVGSKRGIGLINFGGRWGGRKTAGAVAQVNKSGSRHVYAGTFIAKGKGGNQQIFDRVGKKRLPITTLYGASMRIALRDTERVERLATFAQDLGRTEIDRLTQGKG